ncbi:histidinol dehydrogenase [Candidatus Bathyarchaeota archaeon]|nr:histidinol dehydrogenase [Candidatus Bathyarchaeota archaeon]
MIPITKTEPVNILRSRWPNNQNDNQELINYVSKIIGDVKERGDQAVIEYTEKFDKVTLKPDQIIVSKEEIIDAYSKVTKKQIVSLRRAKERLEKVEKKRLELLNFDIEFKGIRIYNKTRPLNRVGCYVPGGKVAYPSTVIMNIVPAQVAGVKEIIVVTPPNSEGKINPLTLVAADICKLDSIYRIGGIQAIAALAFGTKKIKKVDKIVGPGNKYVTTAKNFVSKQVAIDKPAGPTEILILADDTADPYFISLDLISQAEHGPGGISGLVTDSEELAKKVQNEVEERLLKIPESSKIRNVLSEGGFIYVVKNIEEAISFSENFAPEHIEIIAKESTKIAEKINNAGLILIGKYSTVSATDYLVGVNHVLPTEGYGKLFSGLTVLDFLKPISIVKITKEGLKEIYSNINALSEAEGLLNHSRAVQERLLK